MANHTYSKGLLYKKTLNSSGEVTGSVPLLLKTLGSLVIMSDGTDAETAISTAISNMVTPDETTIVTGLDGITISVKKSTSAEIDEILGDVPTSHTWEGYYTKSETEALVGAVDAKFNQNDIETALGYTPIASSVKGSANGVASLDANGLVPSAQLPSYVDDVIESATFAALPATGETGKIYVTLNDNKTYRWSGSAYAEISQSLALGETSSTAFAGDKGKIAYDHASDTTKHVPTGGTNAQYLKNTGNNTYAWASPDSSWPATPTNNTIPGNKLVDDRFKVNETNILSVLNRTGKNIVNIQAPTSTRGCTFVEGNNGAVTITNTENWSQFITNVHVKPNTQYKLVFYTDAISNLPAFDVYPRDHDTDGSPLGANFRVSNTGTIVKDFTSVSDVVCLNIYPNNQSTTVSGTATIRVMICEKTLYDLSNEYTWGIPNYDLTYLQAEDRAALAEEIDAGAKSLVPMTWTNADPFADIHMTKNSDGSITVTATNTAAARIVSLSTNINNYLTAGKKYVLSGCDGGDYSNHYGFALSTSNYTGRVFEANGSEEFTYASEVVNFTLVVRAGESWTKTFKPMICTKAAFGVSNKFVPYVKSNSQLTTELGSVKTVLEAIL